MSLVQLKTKRLSKQELLLPDNLQPAIRFFLAFRFERKHPLFLELGTAGLWTGTIPVALLQLADYRFWDLSASIMT
jgi:hypothetical protein